MANKYLDNNGVAYFWEKIKNALAGKVNTETGKGLSTNDYTSAEKTKLAGIETGAQVNVLEGIQVAGTSVTPTNKIANVPGMTGATASAAGKAGVVPAPAAGNQAKYLRGDGSWATPDNTTYDPATANPLMDGTAAVGTSAKYAREDHVHPTDTSRMSAQADATTIPYEYGSNVSIAEVLDGKVEAVSGKGLSSNDYTTEEKTKLAGIATGAEVNVQSDWNQTTTTADDYIKNKPSIPAKGTATPLMDGTGSAGSGSTWAAIDHVHPTDTSRAAASHSHVQSDLDGAEVWKASSSTTASTAAKTATCSGYAVKAGAIVEVTSSTANTSSGALTLNVNSTGAYPIKVDGASTSSSNPLLWGANETLLFAFNGSASNGSYNFLSKSGKASTSNYGMTKLNSATNSTSTTEAATPSAVKSAYDLANAAAPKASPELTGTPTAPTASEGTNTTQIATTAFVTTAVANAIAGVTSISYEIVSTLPATGSAGVIYLVAHSHGTQDVYDEYIWTGSAFEKIGNTDIDLSGYMLKTDMEAITNAEIDTICV